jgi:hypothetical protein
MIATPTRSGQIRWSPSPGLAALRISLPISSLRVTFVSQEMISTKSKSLWGNEKPRLKRPRFSV